MSVRKGTHRLSRSRRAFSLAGAFLGAAAANDQDARDSVHVRFGIRIVTFEACSGFTRVTAHRIAQSPKATVVTRLRPFRSPGRAARQLPDQSTIIWVDSSSTGDSRLRGALPKADLQRARQTAAAAPQRPLRIFG